MNTEMSFSRLSNRSRFLFVLAMIAMAACSDDEPARKNEPKESSVTLNGGPYSNVTANTEAASPAVAVYSAPDNITTISYSAMLDGREFFVAIAFPGNAKGEYAWNEDDCFVQTVEEMDDTEESVTSSYYTADGNEIHEGSVKIDDYGRGVGDIVSGSFQGDATFVELSCGCVSTGTIKGSFSAQRIN